MLSRSGAVIIGIIFILSMCDVFRAEESPNVDNDFVEEFGDESADLNQENRNSDEIVPLVGKINKTKHLPTLKFLYCVSCGYKQAFTQFSELAKENYPDLVIEGDNFSSDYLKTYLAHSVGLLKMIILIVIMTGSNPFENLGFGYPALLQHAHSNKISTGIFVYMIGNMIESSLLSTGAFEIFIGGEQIWSKIETGRVPSQEEFIQLIKQKIV